MTSGGDAVTQTLTQMAIQVYCFHNQLFKTCQLKSLCIQEFNPPVAADTSRL